MQPYRRAERARRVRKVHGRVSQRDWFCQRRRLERKLRRQEGARLRELEQKMARAVRLRRRLLAVHTSAWPVVHASLAVYRPVRIGVEAAVGVVGLVQCSRVKATLDGRTALAIRRLAMKVGGQAAAWNFLHAWENEEPEMPAASWAAQRRARRDLRMRAAGRTGFVAELVRVATSDRIWAAATGAARREM